MAASAGHQVQLKRTGAQDVVAAGRGDLLIQVRLPLADRRTAVRDLARGALAAAHRLLDFLQHGEVDSI